MLDPQACYPDKRAGIALSHVSSLQYAAVRLPQLVRDVVDFCYPGLCAECRTPCDANGFLCGTCLSGLAAIESAPACELCGAPLAQLAAPCPFCQGNGVPHYDRIVRLGTFDGALKDLIHQFKYQRRWAVGEHLARRLLEQQKVKELLAQADVLVAVPLHFRRQLGRGYNQAAVIARSVAKACGKPVVRPIVRVRATETQTHLHSRDKRFENLRGAFELRRPASIAGKRVLVVDDVTTTGATLQTMARAMLPARPKSLCALVLAIADPKGRGFQAV